MIRKILKKFEKRAIEKSDEIKGILGKQLCFSQKQINAT